MDGSGLELLGRLIKDIDSRLIVSRVKLRRKLLAVKDSTVLDSKLSLNKKIFLLKLKHGDRFYDFLVVDKKTVYYQNYKLINFGKERVHLDFVTHKHGDQYKIEGFITRNPFWNLVKIQAVLGDESKPIRLVKRAGRERWFGSFMYDDGGSFEVDLKLSQASGRKLQFTANVGEHEFPLKLRMGPFTRLGNVLGSYRPDSLRLLSRGAKSVNFRSYSRLTHVFYELRFLFLLLFNWQLRHVAGRLVRIYKSGKLSISQPKRLIKEMLISAGIVAEAIVMIPRAITLRIAYYIAKPRVKKPIWLVSDRVIAAGDNGEALFRYIAKQKNCSADVYFVISDKSKDYNELRKVGKVLNQSSLKYKLKFLLADKIISSQANIETTNPFIRQIDHFVDLYGFDFIFLQHGVIRHDLSNWLNRYNKNIRLFITTGEKEYDSILNNPYYYPKENVLLSGQPRYDFLENKPNKKLILSPTYRKRLALEHTNKRGERKYDPQFKNTEYRNFYNNLMNDSRIVGELKKQGMTGEFYLHPVFEAQRQDFDENGSFKLMRFPYDYKKAFSEGELLISDHSSVVFDFVYLKKPTVYAHFDADTFFDGHSYEKSNFFRDEDDGFGDVFYNYETLVKGVVDLLRNGRKMPDAYLERVESFFYKVDKNNSKRVYGAILELE